MVRSGGTSASTPALGGHCGADQPGPSRKKGCRGGSPNRPSRMGAHQSKWRQSLSRRQYWEHLAYETAPGWTSATVGKRWTARRSDAAWVAT